MFSFLRKSGRSRKAPVYRIPPGRRVYAVGDIHGRADLLGQLHREIIRDAERETGEGNLVVYLGDYIDRGGMVRQVVDELIAGPPAGFQAVYLRGNHEEMLLRFLEDVSILDTWLALGGQATLLSYQVAAPASGFSAERALATRDAFVEALPAAHLDFFRGLQTRFQLGDYFFAHAGVRPGVALDDQDAADLLWIRDEFLGSQEHFAARVVHGHSIQPEPQLLPNRIGLDTGAYATGVLSCAVLEGDQVRMLGPGGPLPAP